MPVAKKSDPLPPVDGRLESLKVAIAQIEKSYGEGSIMKLGDSTKMDIASVPTGSLTLDIALGIGGIPKGRIVEVYGPESGGKTTLTLHMIAEVQKLGGRAAFIDAEHALDPSYAARLGVHVEDLYVSQPDDGEQALEIAETMVRSGAIDIVVIDSVAALVPKAEIEGEMGETQVGLQARLMSKALRKLAAVAGKSNCVIVFINQLRLKIGNPFGNPETTTGGLALKYGASVRLDIRKGETLKSATNAIGSRTKVKVVKNKVAPPFKTAEFDLMYGTGISHSGEVADLGTELDIIHKGGSWFTYGDLRWQGRDAVKRYLEENSAVCVEIENKIRSNYGLPLIPTLTSEQPKKAETKRK